MTRGAGLVSEQAEQFLNLCHRQHGFDIVGEHTGVHLGDKGEEQKIDKNGKYIFQILSLTTLSKLSLDCSINKRIQYINRGSGTVLVKKK